MADDTETVDPQNAPPTGNVNANAKQVLTDNFNKGPLDSKKWLAMMIGLSCVMVIFFTDTSLIAMTDAVKANSYNGISTQSITFIGMMVSILIGGSSAVDWKTSDALSDMHNTEIKAAVDTQNQNINQNFTKTVHIDVPYTKDMDDKIKEDGDEATPDIKPFSAPAQP